ncbi:RNase H domain-containing protein [Durusdinium trenchii]|uniref:RNase H domain-containing protein n=1 Tax=Durusdinium trenchii TaxID=1381693 RepID=A0ABP0RG60_9DINO
MTLELRPHQRKSLLRAPGGAWSAVKKPLGEARLVYGWGTSSDELWCPEVLVRMDYGGGSEKGVRDRSRLASAAAGEAAHLAHEAGHMAQEAVRSAQAAAAKQEERRWADEIAAKRRAAAKGGRSRQDYRVEVEAPESACSLYAFTKCNGFERTFINSASLSLQKISNDITFWEKEIARGITSTPKGQMRYATMVHLLKEMKAIAEKNGESALKAKWDWSVRVKAQQEAAPLPRTEARMDASTLQLTEKAWELRLAGDRCFSESHFTQAVRNYEWAMDVLRPVPVEHAGPSRCALLLKLGRCFLKSDLRRNFSMDPHRALRCCEQVKENDLHGTWQAEAQCLKEEAFALLPDGTGEAMTFGYSSQAPRKTAISSRQIEPKRRSKSNNTVYCLELNSVQTFNMLDTTLTDDLFFAMDAIKEDRMRRG